MSTGKLHDVTVMGRGMRIRSDDAPEHVQTVVERVNATLDELSDGKAAQAPSQQVMLMALLNLADALVKIEGEHAALTERIRSTSRRLLAQMTPKGEARVAAGALN